MKRYCVFGLAIMVLVVLSGCADISVKGATKIVQSGADFDEGITEMLKEQIPRYMKAWPTFSGLFEGALGKEKSALLTKEVTDAWAELDRFAAKPDSELTDKDRAKWFATKFCTFLTPATLAVIKKKVPAVLIGSDMLELFDIFGI